MLSKLYENIHSNWFCVILLLMMDTGVSLKMLIQYYMKLQIPATLFLSPKVIKKKKQIIGFKV